MSRNYRFYLEDIQENARYILQYTAEMDFNGFGKDVRTVNATIKHLENIGEAARQLPDSVTIRYPDINWKEMIALRNVLIHHYFGINYQLIWATITEDIPILLDKIGNILDSEPPLITE